MSIQTPRDVALRTSLIITLLLVILLAGGYIFYTLLPVWLWIPLGALVTFAGTYGVVYWSTEKFIYQKVKIIYKTIHRFKSQRDKRREINMNEDVMTKVNTEVMTWAEDRIKEITDLKEADSFRRDFIGNLAHELKTPIFNIQGYILTLLEGALEDPANNRKFLMKAAKNVDRITALIEDLDSIHKIESSRYELNISRFNMVELATEIVESMEQKGKRNGITVKLKNPNERSVFVKADKPKIEQVLINLIVNSINYGKEGGETLVRFYDMEDTLLIEVADNGIGIAPDHLSRIFERFYRVDKSRSRHAGGSGLGLSIVKHIIDAHDQTINVRSSPDMGSTFSFTLQKD
jgi:two-component system, OmpR family, phosphate regulon sensor histidine kinase PhoR